MMKALLLGASGQLGKEWQRIIDEDYPDEIKLLPYTSSDLDITHYQEVSDEFREQKPDVVINCAAFTDVDGAEDHKKLARKVNMEAPLYLTELSQQLEFKLMHFSTDYVFPGTKRNKKEFPGGYPEEHPADPVNWYGKTKWEGEQAIRQTTENHLIIRVSWLCGQFGSNFVKTMLKLGQEREELQVVNDQWGSPSFAENVVENCLNLLGTGAMGTYHVTSKGLITWYDLAKAIFKKSDIEVHVEAVDSDAFPTKAKRPYFSKLGTQKIEDIEDSKIVDWRKGLQNLLDQLQ
ncbi:dTDP-4-dehydrorhamnose reductase [Aliifodinibius salipaludis]|uniref:dTDP-4-dehydrorhamnose reductase n=1 Tax=Fodinibius salipaludis TaxID=2032627 RepID=A0A2A2G8W8_9BACT|nr:dTDP-4-dehydrorhamnose reductase [Aliifodinibius salipaludis]PAU93287.1 dTDP-4-dehydrorhamnose reductase [Aliifodinibius salipaludis]